VIGKLTGTATNNTWLEVMHSQATSNSKDGTRRGECKKNLIAAKHLSDNTRNLFSAYG
jgi:hypothetical protein